VRPKIVLYGAGGHGKVVADIVEKQGKYELAGFLDDAREGEAYGLPILGGEAALADVRGRGIEYAICTVGAAETREKIDEKLLAVGFSLALAAHPSAQIARGAALGEGSVVMPGAVVGPDAVLGRSCIVNTGASVDHDCRLGAYVHVGPGARLGGEVVAGARSLIGIGASVVKGRNVGRGATVGAGAVAVKDVAPNVTVVGVPAKPLRKG
jgi:sugar O-acyltransferase (sialic acid O-acetyltransferase NeuD family)